MSKLIGLLKLLRRPTPPDKPGSYGQETQLLQNSGNLMDALKITEFGVFGDGSGNDITVVLLYALFCLFLIILRRTATFLLGIAGILAGAFIAFLLRSPSEQSPTLILAGADLGAVFGAGIGYYLTRKKSQKERL